MRLLATAALIVMSCAVVPGQKPGDATPLKVGDQAPDFSLTSTAGAKIKLSDFRARNPVVLAFFPAAFTGG
jgi:peroxiredoxin